MAYNYRKIIFVGEEQGEIKMLQLEDAVQLLLENITKITDVEEIPVLDALGRILAEEGKAKQDQPPFPRSPLDGYAVRGTDSQGASKDTPKIFRVIGKVYAGSEYNGTVGEGEAVRIMTGAPIPDGADTVIRQEDSDYGEDQVQIYRESLPYSNYCFQGEDYKKDTVLLKKGSVLDSISVAILASMGYATVRVYRQVKVSVISTGDELMPPGTELKPGKIYDSNRYYVTGRLMEMGIHPVISCHCTDEADEVAEKIRETEPMSDVIITTGGVSVGQKDIMHHVIEVLGAERLFWRVDMKPGAPVLAAIYRKKLIICLSGNPYGAAVNFELLVRPVLAKLTENEKWKTGKQRAVIQNSFPKRGRRFVRGYMEEGKVWIADGNHASGVMSAMIGCNCLIEIPEQNPGVKEGDSLWVYPL